MVTFSVVNVSGNEEQLDDSTLRDFLVAQEESVKSEMALIPIYKAIVTTLLATQPTEKFDKLLFEYLVAHKHRLEQAMKSLLAEKPHEYISSWESLLENDDNIFARIVNTSRTWPSFFFSPKLKAPYVTATSHRLGMAFSLQKRQSTDNDPKDSGEGNYYVTNNQL